MSTAAVTASLFSQTSPGYFQQRRADLQQLSQDLQSGNLSAAQQDFASLQSLAQSGPFAGSAFKVSARQQDFAAIGQALQAGDLAGAQQAFAQLQSTFQPAAHQDPPPPAAGSSAASSPSEIVLNLGNTTPGEQITINLSSGGNSGEQVALGIANQQGASQEQITLNLNPSSNAEIVLNLFNPSASGSTQGGAVSFKA